MTVDDRSTMHWRSDSFIIVSPLTSQDQIL